MNAAQTKSVPDLRFPEFDGEWQQIQLGKLLSFKNGVNATKEQYGKGVKFINVLDIINNDFITYENIIGRVEISESEFEKNKVTYGDILFQRSSETREEVGQANVYLDKERAAAFGGFVIRGKKQKEYDPSFMNSLLKTSAARKEITSKSGGSTRYNVGQETLSSVVVYLCEVAEQQKIADFLSAVDRKIQQLSEKHRLLTEYKKGVMQQIFSREIRFIDDSGQPYPDWEEKRLGSFLKERKDFASKGGDFEHVSLTVEGVVPKSARYERDFLVNTDDKQYKITQLNDICYNPANLKFGVICRNKYGAGIFSPIYVTYDVVNQNNQFVEYLVTRRDFIQKARRFEEGTVYERMAVKPSDLKKLMVFMPCIAEQNKIADFLGAIDSKIDSVSSQLEQAQTFKKGLLQQMFV